jgi:hypothetical protein
MADKERTKMGYSFVPGKKKVASVARIKLVPTPVPVTRRKSSVTIKKQDAPPAPVKSEAEINRAAHLGMILESHLQKLGATPPVHPLGAWILETLGGVLFISVFGDKVICRFEDVKRAKLVIGRNLRGRIQDDGRWGFSLGPGTVHEQAENFKLEIYRIRRYPTAVGVAVPAVTIQAHPVIVPAMGESNSQP